MEEQISTEAKALAQEARKPYLRPQIEVIKMETESFICTSVAPKVPGSQQEEWTEHEEEGGELEL